MTTSLSRLALLATCALSACATQPKAANPTPPAPAPQASAAAVASHPWEEPANLAPKTWLVLGPFPHTYGSCDEALDTDLLSSLGGESQPKITNETVLDAPNGKLRAASLAAEQGSIIDFKAHYKTETAQKIAYAYGEVTVDTALTAKALFGSDDGAAVWVNGKLVHRIATTGRGLNPNEDQFELSLKEGKNTFLVKVENGQGDWGFSLRVMDEAGQRRVEALEARRNLERLEPQPRDREFHLRESFPKLVWGDPEAALLVLGDAKPSVHWYGPTLERVERPDAVGPYVAVVEAKLLDGHTYRRMLTFAKSPPGSIPEFHFAPPFGEPPTITTKIPFPLTPAQEAELSRHFWRALSEYFWRGENGAIALTSLGTLGQTPPPVDEASWTSSGFVTNAQHQLSVRMRLEGRTARKLEPPAKLAKPAPELRKGSEADAGVAPGTVRKLRALATEWLKTDPNGFSVVVARRGVVFMHEGFGGFGKDEAFYPASIGKLVAGLKFARAVDQGLVRFDDPIGSVLPDWQHERARSLTFRHCFHHLTGLEGHASHGGLFNAYLDNALFVQDEAFVEPLARHQYNGDGYNLAGKALELLTGQTIFRLLYENLQRPLGENVTQFDLGFGSQFTPMYLAKIGQMLLQDGQYGAHRFYSPGFVTKLRPSKVADTAPGFPNKELEWGIGQTWATDPSSEPRDKGVLGPNVFGHGAASGSIFRVAPDHELVVVIGRNGHRDWASNERFAGSFMTVLAEGLRK